MSSRESMWLAGGLAPSVWQREIAQNTVWVKVLHSAYSWTRAFTAPQPMLNNEPLSGQLLTLLTTAIAQPTQNSPEALRPTRVKPTRVQGSTNHEPFLPGNNMTRSRTSKADPVAQQRTAAPTLPHVTSETLSSSRKRRWTHQAAAVAHAKPDRLAQIDQRVDDVRLHQWAGTTASGMNSARTASSPPAQWSRIGANASHTPPPPGTREGAVIIPRMWLPYHGRSDVPGSLVHGRSAPREYPGGGTRYAGTVDEGVTGASSQNWQHSLIEQTRRMLQHTYQPPVGHAEQEELLLARQWATTIGEQVAPLELLQHYATLSRQDSEAVNRNGQNGQNNANALSSLPENGVPAKVNTVGNTSNHAESLQLDNRDVLALLAGAGNANNSRNQQTSLIEDAEQQSTEREQRTADFVEHILPPQVTAQLPPLITAQRIDMPPLPVAAATARFGARAEMMIEEDLDVLAAKIKRILDDEARRHGIDV